MWNKVLWKKKKKKKKVCWQLHDSQYESGNYMSTHSRVLGNFYLCIKSPAVAISD